VRTKIDWKDPPPAGRGRPSYISDCRPDLRAAPGRWARLASYASAGAAINGALRTRASWGEEFEVVYRGRAVFARYIGTQGSAP
jgi:hypothetical protein